MAACFEKRVLEKVTPGSLGAHVGDIQHNLSF